MLNAVACEMEYRDIGPITQKKNKEFDFVQTSNAILVYVDLNYDFLSYCFLFEQPCIQH